MKKNTLFGILSLLLIFGVGFFVFVEGNSGINGKVILNTEAAQVIKIHVEGSQYVLEPNTVKAGTPVRLEADISRMPGCSKSLVIPGFNVKEVVNENDNSIEFTPNKAGTFNIACSMNMYKGTLTVLDSDGTKSNYVEKASSKGMTCGAGGGGCGCGG